MFVFMLQKQKMSFNLRLDSATETGKSVESTESIQDILQMKVMTYRK